MHDLIRRLSCAVAFSLCHLFGVFIFGSGPSVVAQDAMVWERYNPKDEDFSVLLPDSPSFMTFARPEPTSNFNPIFGRIYNTYSDGTVYLILSLDNPGNKGSLQTFIKEFKGYPVSVKEAAFEKDISVSGIKGKQYRLESGLLKGIAQFFITRSERAYIFVVVGEDTGRPAVDRFLSSIALDRRGQAPLKPSANQGVLVQAETQKLPAGESVFTSRDLTRKPIIVSRPEPGYSEAGRQNRIEGKVVLRAVFDARGYVNYIRVIKELPSGMTEQAVMAARNTRFIPAVKDGAYVSTYIQIEYEFNLSP